jgi:anti-sigma regulatory factor (Ser/Thr protein kinase)
MPTSVPAVIDKLFASREVITSGEVATAAGVSRQAAHYHLKAMEKRGEVIHEGAGRGGRYRRRSQLAAEYPLDGLEEHVVWTEEYYALKKMDPPVLDNARVKPILDFAFTEMVNNAIDHSGGTVVATRWFLEPDRVAFEVEDDGVGAFRRMRESRGLERDFDSIGEIAKGKQTTAPQRHSGLGIYFSSRMASRFILSSGQLTWTVDNEREDEAIGWLDQERRGTLVRCEVSGTTTTEITDVFDAFSDAETFGFNKSTIRVSLFGEGDFVSRSEAKRMGAHLETFDLVELDFTGIQQVGQGFVDELFRVWPRDHPGTRLVPVHANPAVVSMIAKAVPPSVQPQPGTATMKSPPDQARPEAAKGRR